VPPRVLSGLRPACLGARPSLLAAFARLAARCFSLVTSRSRSTDGYCGFRDTSRYFSELGLNNLFACPLNALLPAFSSPIDLAEKRIASRFVALNRFSRVLRP
jgi:hypothetical protein